MDTQSHLNATLFGCWLMHLQQDGLSLADHIALTTTLMRSDSGSILTAGGSNFNFAPHLREYIVKCKDGRVLTLWALNRTVARRVAGWHNVIKIYE